MLFIIVYTSTCTGQNFYSESERRYGLTVPSCWGTSDPCTPPMSPSRTRMVRRVYRMLGRHSYPPIWGRPVSIWDSFIYGVRLRGPSSLRYSYTYHTHYPQRPIQSVIYSSVIRDVGVSFGTLLSTRKNRKVIPTA